MKFLEIVSYILVLIVSLNLGNAQKNSDVNISIIIILKNFFICIPYFKISRKCSKTLVCGVGSCCRGSDNKVIPAALQQFTDVDWWRAQIGINPGNCTSSPATEGNIYLIDHISINI